MRTTFLCFLLAVLVATAAFYAERHRSLNELRTENATLRTQADAPSTVPQTAAPDPAPVVRLNDDDEKELLQLRSKLLPLREQMRAVSNRVAALQSPRTPERPLQKAQDEAIRAEQAAKVR